VKWLVILDFDLDIIELKMDTPASPFTKRGEGLSSAIIQLLQGTLWKDKSSWALCPTKNPAHASRFYHKLPVTVELGHGLQETPFQTRPLSTLNKAAATIGFAADSRATIH
jgi:hypothetical protein